MKAVNEFRWFNPTQPQTLQIAVMLAYISAIFGFLGGAFRFWLGLLILAGLVGGAVGIANEKKWGYAVAVGVAVLQVLIMLIVWQGDILREFDILLSFGFDVALLALLVHPMSRDYQRIWFR